MINFMSFQMVECPNFHQDLLEYLINDDFENFSRTVSSLAKLSLDIDHIYEQHEKKTLLGIACSEKNKAQFVKSLLRHGADPNKIADGKNKTAIDLAAEQEEKDVLQLLLSQQATNIEKSKRKFGENKNIMVKNETYHAFAVVETLSSYKNPIRNMIAQDKYEDFEVTTRNNICHEDNRAWTYLQYASDYGRANFVELLLERNANPNEISKSNDITPIMIAAYNGFHDIVQLLLNTGIIRYDIGFVTNILHAVMHGFYESERRVLHEVHTGNNSDYAKCLELILNNVPDEKLGVNDKDALGNTPLLYAVLLDERDMILQMLERGAYIGVQAWVGYSTSLIKLFKPATLEYFLDRSITLSCTDQDTIDFEISSEFTGCLRLNYSLLVYEQKFWKNEQIDEIKPLIALSEVPELRHSLKHLFFLIYLDYKWHVIARKFCYTNLGFFFQFFLILNLYLFRIDFTGPGKDYIPNAWDRTFKILVIINNGILLFKELTQLLLSRNILSYVKDIPNWLEITLFATICIILLDFIQSNTIRAYLAALAIFLSYVELTLLLISHSGLCTFIEMFKTVTESSFKLLRAYALIVLAFASSFYIIFKNYESNSNPSSNSTSNSNNTDFNNPFKAAFKTLIMLTGEYDLSNIFDNDSYGINRLIFLLFVFLVPVVLFNLLNAVAISDIKRIEKNAEIDSIVARVTLIARIEEMMSRFFTLIVLFSTSIFTIIDLFFKSFFTIIDMFFDYHNAWATRQSEAAQQFGLGLQKDILQKRYRYTNHFSTIDNYDKIDFYSTGENVLMNNEDKSIRRFLPNLPALKYRKIPISPFTQRSFREQIAAKATDKTRAPPFLASLYTR